MPKIEDVIALVEQLPEVTEVWLANCADYFCAQTSAWCFGVSVQDHIITVELDSDLGSTLYFIEMFAGKKLNEKQKKQCLIARSERAAWMGCLSARLSEEMLEHLKIIVIAIAELMRSQLEARIIFGVGNEFSNDFYRRVMPVVVR